MKKVYYELWRDIRAFHAVERGEELHRLAQKIGTQRPHEDWLAKFTWRV